jgi:hypothetical protein
MNLRNAMTVVSETVTTPPEEHSGDPGARYSRSMSCGVT